MGLIGAKNRLGDPRKIEKWERVGRLVEGCLDGQTGETAE